MLIVVPPKRVDLQLGIVDRQYQLARVSDAATELYVSACVLNRLDFLLRELADLNDADVHKQRGQHHG